MCCFAGPVKDVSNTQIFARLTGEGSQLLVYRMQFASEAENAMILPLPVATPAADDGVRFIDLKGYDDFFEDLESGFPVKPPFELVRSKGDMVAAASAAPQLAVHEVGDYVASFVPTISAFERLDPRFRIAPDTWAKVPGYGDYGFAVFQLKQKAGRPHPMAFEFRTRLAEQTFFPTVHIHDGEVHAEEGFDHTLYLQSSAFDPMVGDYEDHDVADDATGFVRSDRAAGLFVDTARAKGVVAGDLLVHKRELRGTLPNADSVFGPPQASIVPRGVGRWGLPGAGVIAAAAGLGWVIARRRKLAREAKAES